MDGNNFQNRSKADNAAESNYETILFPFIYILVLLTGGFGNLIAIFLTYMYVQQKNILGIYLMNLCISDIMYIMTLPLWITYTARHESWPFGETPCRITGFVFYTNNYTTIMFLCCIALDRCLAVAFPLKSRGVRRQGVAVAACAFVWALLICSHVPLIAQPQLNNDSHNHTLCYERRAEPWVICDLLVGFLIPLCLIVASYSCIIHVVRRTSVVERRQKVKIIGLVVAILVIFVVSFLPYHVLLLMRWLKYKSNEMEPPFRNVYKICFTLTSISSALNPFLNVFVSENFPKDFRNMLTMLRCCPTRLKCCKRRDAEVQQQCGSKEGIQPSTKTSSL